MTFLRSLVFFGLIVLPSFANAGPIKNQQTLIGGILTRAGVSGQTQLSDDQLRSLCESGYTKAFFLYSGATARSVSCSRGSISYRSISWTSVSPVIQAVDAGLRGGGKVFVHCHNGAHASGYVAAMALRQFCGYSSEQALAYFNRTNTYGTPPGMARIRAGLKGTVSSVSTSSSCR